MLGDCWASVVDGGPAVTQFWVNVSCFLGQVILSPLSAGHDYIRVFFIFYQHIKYHFKDKM